LLIIDDFGTEKYSDWSYEKIFNLVDTRYRSEKPIIINSNLSGTNLVKYFKAFDPHMRVADRIRSKCKTFKFNWESEREPENTEGIFQPDTR